MVIPTPCWVELPEQVRARGRDAGVRPVDARGGRGRWRLRPSPLLHAAHQGGGALLAVQPHRRGLHRGRTRSPTCSARTTAGSGRRDLRRPRTAGSRSARSSRSRLTSPTAPVIVDGASKTFAMTGWRVAGRSRRPRWRRRWTRSRAGRDQHGDLLPVGCARGRCARRPPSSRRCARALRRAARLARGGLRVAGRARWGLPGASMRSLM